MFDWSSHSRALDLFTGEWRFSKSMGLSASVSCLPLPHPLFLILALAPISRAKYAPVLFLGFSLLPNPTETLAMQAIPSPSWIDMWLIWWTRDHHPLHTHLGCQMFQMCHEQSIGPVRWWPSLNICQPQQGGSYPCRGKSPQICTGRDMLTGEEGRMGH